MTTGRGGPCATGPVDYDDRVAAGVADRGPCFVKAREGLPVRRDEAGLDVGEVQFLAVTADYEACAA